MKLSKEDLKTVMHLNGKRKNKKMGFYLIFHHSMGLEITFILSTTPTGKGTSSISPIFLNGSSANTFIALAPNIVPINRTIERRSKVFEGKII
ncbi:MAG TPA: hypothetical protein VJ250_04360 [Nitrososphaeraceae archaeon]|nr:hypothetical protein [Nitrososphaeraceae archaeon]